MGRHGTVWQTEKIVDNGPNYARYNLVMLGDGFNALEFDRFRHACSEIISHMSRVPPFSYRLLDAINVHCVRVTSVDSGITDPAACGGPGITRKTYFDATYCGRPNVRRAITLDESIVLEVCNNQVPNWHGALVLVNATEHGGTHFNSICTASLATSYPQNVVHELGHLIGGLGDEYDYEGSCETDFIEFEQKQDRAFKRTYTMHKEPSYPNLTINTIRETLKWAQWVDRSTPIPTMLNHDCSECDHSPNPYDDTTVGLYMGGFYKTCGVFRPQYTCIMRDAENHKSFCRVCSEAIDATLLPYRPQKTKRLWFAIRPPSGIWKNEEDTYDLVLPGPKRDQLACCALNGSLHLFVRLDGKVYRNQRYPSGAWRSKEFESISFERKDGQPALTTVTHISVTEVGQQVFLSVIADGAIFVNILSPNGDWSKFQKVSGTESLMVTGAVSATPSRIASAAVDGCLLLAMILGGRLWVTQRRLDGQWTKWEELTYRLGITNATDLACCRDEAKNLTLFVVENNNVAEARRSAAGVWSWATSRSVNEVCSGVTGPILDCAGNDSVLYLLGSNSSGIYVAARTNGKWQARIDQVKELPTTATKVGCALVGGALNVVSSE